MRTFPIALVAALALGVSACGPETEVTTSADQGSAAVTEDTGEATGEPQGRVSDIPAATDAPSVEERGVSGRAKVDVPEDWAEEQVDDQFDLRYLSGDGETDPLISISGDFGRYGLSQSAAAQLIAQIQMGTPGFEIHNQDPIEVPGAQTGTRVDFSWGTEEEGGVYDGMWLTAVDGDTLHAVAVAFSGGEGTISDEEFDRVAESFEILPEQG